MRGAFPALGYGCCSGSSSPALPPKSFDSRSIDNFETNSLTAVPFGGADGPGGVLGFDVPQQVAGTFVVVTMLGTMSNNGGGENPQITCLANGVAQNTYPMGGECGGGGATEVGGTFRIACSSTGVTEIRFTLYSRTGNNVGVYPVDPLGHPMPSGVYVTGILTT